MALKLAGEIKDGRVVKNLAFGTLDTATTPWTKAEVASGTVTYSADFLTATFDSGASADRAFLSRSISVTSGKSYALRLSVSDKVSTFSRENIDITGDLAASVEVNDIGNGLRGVVVTANADGTINFRIGIGIDGTDNGTKPQSFSITGVMIEELPAGQTVPSEYINVYGPTEPLTNRTTVGFAQDVNSTLDAPGSGAGLTESYSDLYSFVNDFGVAFIADSFGDENDEIVREYENGNPAKFVYGNVVSGSTLLSIAAADIAAVVRQGEIEDNSLAVQAGTLVIERCVNDIISDTTASTLLAHVQTLTDYAESIGLRVIVANCPPFGNHVSHTAGRETEALAYNSGLTTQYSGNPNVLVYDVLTVLATPATFDLAVAYDSGDGLHPNSTGVAAWVSGVETEIGNLPTDWAVSSLDANGASFGIMQPIMASGY